LLIVFAVLAIVGRFAWHRIRRSLA
jgi:hypothetical protein